MKSNLKPRQVMLVGLASLAALLAQPLLAQAPPPGGAPGAPQPNPPLIDAVSYSGNHEIATAALSKGASIAAGQHISRELVGGEIKRLVALYRQAGHDVAIAPDIQHPADGHVTVTFKIDENGKGGDAGAAPAGGAGPPPGGPPPGGTPPGAPPPH